MRVQFNVRLTTETMDLITRLQRELGVTQSTVVRLAVRLLARRELRAPKGAGKGGRS